ncbi:MAG: hypothetical protein IPQ07_28220 [Myxococcales bacterium]|nr:hypothetical protein [Myxococcales bacterium]
MELQHTHDGQPRFELLMRLGNLEESSIERPSRALRYYQDALAVPAPGGGVRPQAVGAIVRFLLADGPGRKIEPAEKVAAARLILPHSRQRRISACRRSRSR